MKRFNKQKIFIFIILIISLLALLFMFQGFFIDIIKFQLANDTAGMEAFLVDKGLGAPFLIAIMEAVQMICVFISVEFIQTATAMSYPWYVSIIICEVGVLLGASLIYVLVNSFKFDDSLFKSNSRKVRSVNNENKQLIMYLFFITPILPFGFICYYGSKQKMGFKKYIFTVATGALPDILVSTLLGNAIKYVILNDIPFWILILSIVGLAGILLFICSKLIKKAKISSPKNTPDSLVFSLFLLIFKLISKNKPKYETNEQIELGEPYIILSNHPSFFDGYYLYKTLEPIKPAFILNRYYFKSKPMRFLFNRMGIIPKKLFSQDIETIKKSMRTIKNGYSVYMCPEGRLSVDGTNYDVSIETSKFIKQNQVPVIIISFKGSYLAKPKWRKKQLKTKVTSTISRVISKEEVLNLSLEELNKIINDGISFNDFDYAKSRNLKFKYKHKAKGLENILYYCPKCGKEHHMLGIGNTFKCTNCDFKLHINENYWFEENKYNIINIHTYYELIKKYERENIKKGINLHTNVKVKKFNLKDSSLNEEGTGVCYLNNDEFIFEGDLKVGKFVQKIKNLYALAFSAGEEFECYYDNELYYFYPEEDKAQCAKWALIVDELQKV